MDKTELKKFLLYCGKEGYATLQNADEQQEKDHSTSITLRQGLWKFHDNYFGGEPYGGREVVFYQDKPVWIMTYYGQVDTSITDLQPVYQFLKAALAKVPDDAPYRGPKEYVEGAWQYQNNWQGEVDDFSGEETIFLNGKKIYSAKYLGGLIDQK